MLRRSDRRALPAMGRVGLLKDELAACQARIMGGSYGRCSL